MKGKKLTLAYWNNLPKDTKVRALKMINPSFSDWMADEKMKKGDPDWELIQHCARISDSPNYALVMHGHCYMN